MSRTFIGLGASALKIDARTDLIYIGRRDDNAVEVYDPLSLMAMGRIELPDAVFVPDHRRPAEYARGADAGGARRRLHRSRRPPPAGVVDVGADPYQIAVTRERN